MKSTAPHRACVLDEHCDSGGHQARGKAARDSNWSDTRVTTLGSDARWYGGKRSLARVELLGAFLGKYLPCQTIGMAIVPTC